MRNTTFAESQVETDVVGDILAKEDVSEDVTIDDAVQTDETTQEPEITDSTILHSSCYDFDSKTGQLTLKGNVIKDELYQVDYYTVKSVKAEKGTILPEDCSLLFDNYIDCAEIDLSNADTSNARDMSCMFENCKNLRLINLSNFDTGNVKNMECMFAGCNSLTSLDLSHFTVDEYDYLFGIFDECISLKELILNESFKNARYYIDEELDLKITYGNL